MGDDARRLLRTCRAAMGPGSRLLLAQTGFRVERVVTTASPAA